MFRQGGRKWKLQEVVEEEVVEVLQRQCNPLQSQVQEPERTGSLRKKFSKLARVNLGLNNRFCFFASPFLIVSFTFHQDKAFAGNWREDSIQTLALRVVKIDREDLFKGKIPVLNWRIQNHG